MKNTRLTKETDAGIGINMGKRSASLEQPHPVEWMEMTVTDDEDCQLLEVRRISDQPPQGNSFS